jgi:hypothetical protein
VVGYVLLEQCEVLLVVPTTTPPPSPGEDPAAAAGTISPPPPPSWQDVDLRRRGCGGDASFRADAGAVDDGIDDCGAGGRDLVLALAQPRPHPRDGEDDRDAPPPPSWRLALDVETFDGLVRSMKTTTTTTTTTTACEGRGGRRSDASLMAGLAIEVDRRADDDCGRGRGRRGRRGGSLRRDVGRPRR